MQIKESSEVYDVIIVGYGMAGRGESIALKENYCEIDPTTVDEFGIPVLKFNLTAPNI